MDNDYNERNGWVGDNDTPQLGGDPNGSGDDEAASLGDVEHGGDSVDVDERVYDVQREQPDSNVVPYRTSANVVTRSQIRLLKLTDLEKVEWILKKYGAMNIPKIHPMVFYDQLVNRRDTYFLEVSDVGLVWLSGVIPSMSATLHFMFWDGKLGEDRVETLRTCVRTMFEILKLDRLTALTPKKSAPVQRVLREIGFQQEGLIRRGWPGPPVDHLLSFGMLKEEQPWQTLPLPPTSLV